MGLLTNILLETGSSAADLTSSLASSKTVITWVLDFVTENWLLSIVFVLGTLMPAAVKGFKGLKRAAK